MNRHLIAEGVTDIALLQAVLRPEIEANHLRLWAAGGKSAADSLARTVLAVRREPVVLVVDSDGRPREEERYYEASLAEAAPREMWRVCLAEPSIEVCFFDLPESVPSLFGATLTEADSVLARFRPKEVLNRLFHQQGLNYSPEGVAKFLAGKDLAVLRDSDLIKRIRRALEEVREHAVEAV